MGWSSAGVHQTGGVEDLGDDHKVRGALTLVGRQQHSSTLQARSQRYLGHHHRRRGSVAISPAVRCIMNDGAKILESGTRGLLRQPRHGEGSEETIGKGPKVWSQ